MNKKSTVAVFAALAVGPALCADYEILGTNEEGVVSIVVGTSGARITETFRSPEVSRLCIAKDTADVCYLSPAEGANTFTGGVEFSGIQLRYDGPSVADCFGSGPIACTTDTGAFWTWVDVDIPNKFVAGSKMWIASNGDTCRLTLRDVGFNESNVNHVIPLGRSAADSPSVNVLSLTNENCETVGQVQLRGLLDLTIENRLPVGGQLPDVFACYAGHTTGTADVHVSANGVTFDVAEGADVSVGVPLRLDTELHVVETAYPVNWSFESESPNRSEGWSVSTNVNQSTSKGVCESPDDTWCSYTTPYGNKIAVLRWGSKLSTKPTYPVTLPCDGKWRVAFVCASRKGKTNNVGGSVPITVTVDADTDSAVSSTIPPRKTEMHDYLEVATEPFELAAGDHSLQFVTGEGSFANAAVMFDGIRLERVEARTGSVSKTGLGKLTMSGVTSSGALSVLEGTLGFDVAETTNAMTVAVESGACLRLLDAGVTNLVANGSFQKDGSSFTDLTKRTVSDWTWAITKDRGTVNSGGNGLQGNGGNCSTTAPWTMFGTVTAYMRESTSFTQEVDVPADGAYVLSYIEAYRPNYDDTKNIPYTVKIGDATVASGHPTSSSVFTRHLAQVNLKKGRQNLEIHFGDDSLETAAASSGAIVFFDDIRLAPADDVERVRTVALNLESGATLVLDTAYPCMVQTIAVDGLPVRAKNSAVAAAGVTVSGLGRLKPTDKTGLVIVVH